MRGLAQGSSALLSSCHKEVTLPLFSGQHRLITAASVVAWSL